MSSDITKLLREWGQGDAAALDALTPLVYAELRRLAGAFLRRERAANTLQPTALVHEAFLRLVDGEAVEWRDRAHFFGIAARLMRQILVDAARSRDRIKRGGGEPPLTLDAGFGLIERTDVNLVALDDALGELSAFDPRQSRIVELRFFAGLSIEETAVVTELSPATVKREWATAKAWLRGRIERA